MPDGEAFISQRTVDRPATVRPAVESDEAALFDLLVDLYRDNSMGGHAISRAKVDLEIRRGTRKQGSFIGVIEAPDGRLVGSIGLSLAQYWYSEEWYLHEQWLFVLPEFRGQHHDSELFRWAEAIRQNMSDGTGRRWEIVMGFWTPRRLAAKIRLWSRFARQVGGVFIMDGER